MAVRPLTLSELSAITESTIEPPTGFTREDVTRDQVSYYGYFLVIKESEVNLIHQSAKDYILRRDHGFYPELKDFCIEEKAGNHEIAKKCFQYLEDSFLPIRSLDSTGEIISHLEAFPLLSYATRCWHIHARSLPRSDDIFDLSRPLYHKNSRIRELWLKTYCELMEFIFHFDSSTLLHIASYFGILPLAEKLLKGFINKVKRFHIINLKDSKGMTALHWAARDGHLTIARLLLRKGANVNAKAHMDETALQSAATSGHGDLVRLLLENGADINARDHVNDTALHRAAWSGDEGLVRLLLEKRADVNAKDYLIRTPLCWAAWSGYEWLVRLQLEMGADMSAMDFWGRTALHEAARFGHEKVLRLLLERGADMSAMDFCGRTALQFAAISGDEGMFRLILDMGADVNAKGGFYEETAPHSAATSGYEGVVRFILEIGAEIDAKDNDGQTPLHRAAGSKHKSGHEGLSNYY